MWILWSTHLLRLTSPMTRWMITRRHSIPADNSPDPGECTGGWRCQTVSRCCSWPWSKSRWHTSCRNDNRLGRGFEDHFRNTVACHRDPRNSNPHRISSIESFLSLQEKSEWKNNEIYICEAVCDAVREWSEVTRPSADCQTTFFGRFKRFGKILKKSRWTVTRQWSRSRDRRPTVKQRFWMFQAIRKFCEISHWTVTRQWSEVTRPSADCQTTFFGRFKRFGKILKKVAERSRDSGWGHATVGRLSNHVFWTFQAIWENFEKSRWTVTRQWSEVTRPSADCQTTFFGRFKRFGKILKKVPERSRDSGWGHATVGRLSNNVFWTFQAIWENFEKSRWTVTRQWSRSRDRRPTVKQRFSMFQAIRKFCEISHWTVTRQWSEVTRPSADCQTTFFGRFKRFGKMLKKVAERSRDSGWGHATVGRLSNNVFLDVSSDLGKFWKKSLNGHATVVEVTRPSADCQTTFFGRFKQLEFFFKKSLNGHVTVVGGHATVGRLSNNVFWTFQAIWENFEKSRWTVTRQWLRSRDRRPTVKQRFLDVSSDLGKFWEKSLNGHATVVGGHATVGRLSNNVFWTFQAIWENVEKSRWTVTRQWLRSRDRRPTVKQRFSMFQAIRKFCEISHWTVTRQWSEVTRPSADCQTTFLDVSSN